MKYRYKNEFPTLEEVATLAARTKVYLDESRWVYAGTPIGPSIVNVRLATLAGRSIIARARNLIGMGAVKHNAYGSIIIESEMHTDRDGGDCHRVHDISALEELITEGHPKLALERMDNTSWMLVKHR